MANNERAQVALFIDWDNLAISTAADLSGAIPDVRAVVQRAQQFGTIVIARAYAEWQATSDRLAIYRAGVEPVYAPTFRFEPDTATQQGKGKSLADPCMVADCVDALHLFPDISTYVLVTGDKDMIPVVRLAQLRGRRVVVIGPDYVAAVLREMADEFIAYRSLVEGAPARPPEPVRRYGARHQPTTYVRPEKPVATPTPLVKPKPVEVKTPAVETEEVPATVEERAVPLPAEDLRSVFSTIEEILRQRLGEGRDRIRATNLKDALMQRMPGFSERKLGFAKFKDLLRSAEKSGLIQVIAAGPVHWIALPSAPEPVQGQVLAPAETAPAPAPTEAPPSEPLESEANLESQRNEMIRFIYELRDRSRWLTYTYVLTNLISYYARTLTQAQAENQARAMLNYLVQQGVLRVDKEPQEVEVGGARHRVRMCHLNAEHELVAEALGFQPSAGETAVQPYGETTVVDTAQIGPGEEQEPGTVDQLAAQLSAVEEQPAEPEVRTEGVLGGNGSLAPDVGAVEESAVIAEAAAAPESSGETAGETAEAPALSPAAEEMPTPARSAVEQGETVEAEPSKLEQAYAALREVLERETSEEKPMLSASSLRNRLVQALGSFNERELGFARFKDFLIASESAGVTRTKMRGHVTLVGPA